MEIANAVGVSTAAPRSTRIMEGVGARVIRGPDWKWGKQVRLCYVINRRRSFVYIPLLTVELVVLRVECLFYCILFPP